MCREHIEGSGAGSSAQGSVHCNAEFPDCAVPGPQLGARPGGVTACDGTLRMREIVPTASHCRPVKILFCANFDAQKQFDANFYSCF